MQQKVTSLVKRCSFAKVASLVYSLWFIPQLNQEIAQAITGETMKQDATLHMGNWTKIDIVVSRMGMRHKCHLAQLINRGIVRIIILCWRELLDQTKPN